MQIVERITVIGQTVGSANSHERKRLRLDAAARVVRVMRLRRGAERPPIYELVVLSLEHMAERTADREILTDIFEIADAHGLVLGNATERIRIVGASEDVAEHLGVPAGTRVMRFDRVTKTADGVPVEWRLAFRSLV